MKIWFAIENKRKLFCFLVSDWKVRKKTIYRRSKNDKSRLIYKDLNLQLSLKLQTLKFCSSRLTTFSNPSQNNSIPLFAFKPLPEPNIAQQFVVRSNLDQLTPPDDFPTKDFRVTKDKRMIHLGGKNRVASGWGDCTKDAACAKDSARLQQRSDKSQS